METTLYLHAWRLHKGLTQKELALRTGLTQAQVSTLEAQVHIPTLKTLNKLALAFGVGAGELMNPPPTDHPPLSRHDIDAIAEAVVNGKRRLAPRFNRLADAVASLVSRKLNAYSVPGRVVNRGKRWNGKFKAIKIWRLFPELVLVQILSRVDRKLT